VWVECARRAVDALGAVEEAPCARLAGDTGERDAVVLVELELATRAGALGVGWTRWAGGGGDEVAREEIDDGGDERAVEVGVCGGEGVELLLEKGGVEPRAVEEAGRDVIEGDIEDGDDRVRGVHGIGP
jgi:hypothetical protein